MGHALQRDTRTATRTSTQPSVRTQGRNATVRTGSPADVIGRSLGRATQQQAQRTQTRQLTPSETIALVDRLNGTTPNADIERVLMAIDRHRRERTPVPKNAGYRGNWEWVQFEVTRRLKRAIKERDEVILEIRNAIDRAIRELARPQLRQARRPTQAQRQTMTQTTPQTARTRIREVKAA